METWSSSPLQRQDLPSPKPTRVRYGVLAFLSLACMSAYLTRHCISVANTTIQSELQFTTEQMGWILSMFMFGYFWFQVPGGWLGTRLGARVALPSLSVLWSLLTVGITFVSSYLSMLVLRAAFGATQAGLVPNVALVTGQWVPLAQRGMSSALLVTSMSVGGIVTMWLTATLLELYDWRTVFLLYSLVGVVWAVLFFVYFRNKPKEHPRVNQAEQNLIDPLYSEVTSAVADDTNRAAKSHMEDSERRSLLLFTYMIRSRNLWAICSQQFFSAAAYSLFFTWFPAFLEKGYGVTRASAGLMTTAPLVAAVVGYLCAGFVIDFLLARTGNKRISRTAVGCTGMVLCCLFTLASTWTVSPVQLVAMMTVGVLFYAPQGPASWAVVIDVAGRHTAVVMAVVNMAGVVGAFLSPAVVGYLIGHIERTHGNWNLVIYLFAALYFASALCWFFVDSRKPLTES